ncbi:hypothetical protein A9Q99_12890 [Gammaproteobacteria bacterium 45_16_T64]|nr:hypothetical protein A9Q99_12890 [Gammaproteobacteria bacterium 45_16_T64]
MDGGRKQKNCDSAYAYSAFLLPFTYTLISQGTTVDAFVARQPIFDRNSSMVSYELLYRKGTTNATGELEAPDTATSEVIISSFMEMGLEKITQGRLAHINVTPELLISGLFPTECKHLLAPELPNTISIDEPLITAVTSLSAKGFTIILDDFVFSEQWGPILELADIIKLDVQALSEAELLDQISILKHFDITLLAKKVETVSEFVHYHQLGFELFQGFFLAKPEIMNRTKMPKNCAVIMKLIKTLNDPTVDADHIERIVSMDARLAVKLLSIVNSALYSYPGEIDSLQRAIVVLGHEELKRWVTLLSLTSLDDVPSALLHQAMVRAEMCRTLAPDNMGQYFTVGLFSLLDAMIGMPFDKIALESNLPQELVDPIVCHAGPIGEVLAITIAFERGIFHSQRKIAKHSNSAYLHSIQWADCLTNTLRAG